MASTTIGERLSRMKTASLPYFNPGIQRSRSVPFHGSQRSQDPINPFLPQQNLTLRKFSDSSLNSTGVPKFAHNPFAPQTSTKYTVKVHRAYNPSHSSTTTTTQSSTILGRQFREEERNNPLPPKAFSKSPPEHSSEIPQAKIPERDRLITPLLPNLGRRLTPYPIQPSIVSKPYALDFIPEPSHHSSYRLSDSAADLLLSKFTFPTPNQFISEVEKEEDQQVEKKLEGQLPPASPLSKPMSPEEQIGRLEAWLEGVEEVDSEDEMSAKCKLAEEVEAGGQMMESDWLRGEEIKMDLRAMGRKGGGIGIAL